MKKLLVAILAIALVVLAAAPAFAWHRWWHESPGWRHRPYSFWAVPPLYGPPFWGVLPHYYAPPPTVYYLQPPVIVPPATIQPSCRDDDACWDGRRWISRDGRYWFDERNRE